VGVSVRWVFWVESGGPAGPCVPVEPAWSVGPASPFAASFDHFAASEPGVTFVLATIAIHVSPPFVTTSSITYAVELAQASRNVMPTGPGSPCGPWAPVAPVGPCGPVAPAGPVGPVAPVAPVAPVPPVSPVAPVAPAGP